jgi:hypothetical protein
MRWLTCPGSVLLTWDMEDTDSVYAAEGTFAHWIAQLCREQNKPADKFIGTVSECGRFTVDTAFAEGIQTFLDYVNQFPGDPFFEYRVGYDAWVDGGFGTADDIRINEGTCYITDLKFGKGVQVFAPENTQLMMYALGVFQELGHLYDISHFQLNISQPRLDHIDEFLITCEEILMWATNDVQPTAKIALKKDAPFKAGDHCRWCPAKGTCSHRAAWVFDNIVDEIDDVEGARLFTPGLMSNEQLAQFMDLVDAIRSCCNDVEEHVLSEVQRGIDIGGWKLVAGRSNRKWRDEDDAEAAMRAARLKVSQIFPKHIISPAQAEKIVGKKHPLMEEQVTKAPGRPKLAPPSDPRPSVAPDPEAELEDLDEQSLTDE